MYANGHDDSRRSCDNSNRPAADDDDLEVPEAETEMGEDGLLGVNDNDRAALLEPAISSSRNPSLIPTTAKAGRGSGENGDNGRGIRGNDRCRGARFLSLAAFVVAIVLCGIASLYLVLLQAPPALPSSPSSLSTTATLGTSHDGADSGPGGKSQQQQQERSPPSVLLPESMAALKREGLAGAGPSSENISPTEQNVGVVDADCSCLVVRGQASASSSAASQKHACCQRAVIRSHKFGFVLVNELFRGINGGNVGDDKVKLVDPGQGPGSRRYVSSLVATSSVRAGRNATTAGASTARDFRLVLVLRNIYEALASGYLYHKR